MALIELARSLTRRGPGFSEDVHPLVGSWSLRRWTVGPVLVGTVLACVGGCGAERGAEPPEVAPSQVSNPVDESDLATLRLTPKAVERLGIETAPVTVATLARVRRASGVVMVPPGRDLTVTSPVAGTLVSSSVAVASAGERVRKGQVIMSVQPLQADGDVVRREADASARLETARQQAARAKKLLEARAGSAKDEEQARRDLAIAEADHRSARAQLTAFGGNGSGALPLVAPTSGILADLVFVVGQPVAQGAPIFRVFDVDRLWLRVPVHAGDVRLIDARSEVEVRPVGAPAGSSSTVGHYVSAPPSADAVAATVDYYYQLERAENLVPGQRMEVDLALLSAPGEQLQVPKSAIVYDVHGGAWVYEELSPVTFSRRRVQVNFTSGDLAALLTGPPAGTEVVIQGVAELFGAEFGNGK